MGVAPSIPVGITAMQKRELTQAEKNEIVFYEKRIEAHKEYTGNPPDYNPPRHKYLLVVKSGAPVDALKAPVKNPEKIEFMAMKEGNGIHFKMNERGDMIIIETTPKGERETIYDTKGGERVNFLKSKGKSKGKGMGGMATFDKYLCYGSIHQDLMKNVCGGECSTEQHSVDLKTHWIENGKGEGRTLCHPDFMDQGVEEAVGTTEGYMVKREYFEEEATSACPPCPPCNGKIGSISVGKKIGSKPNMHMVLCYGNRYEDLKKAKCGGEFCTTKEHAEALLKHWNDDGKKEERVLCYPRPLAAKKKEEGDDTKKEGYMLPQPQLGPWGVDGDVVGMNL